LESFANEINFERKVVFSSSKSDAFIRSSANERLVISAGTLIRHSDEEDKNFNFIQLVVFDSSSIAYTWIEDNEVYYVNVKQFKLNVPVRSLTLSLSNHSILFIRVTQLATSGMSSEKYQSSSTDVITNQCQYKTYHNPRSFESILISQGCSDLFLF
jgi:hypothetical protein